VLALALRREHHPGMRRTWVLLLLGALSGALVVLGASPAQACSCAGGTTAEFTERADAVFTGRLVSRDEPSQGITSSADPALHVFAVDAVAKGAVSDEQEVLSPVSGASCGLELTGDGPVVVFATRTADPYLGDATPPLEDDQYYAYLCGGSAPLTPQLEAELGPLQPVAPATVPATPVEPRAGATTAPDRDGPSPAILVPGGGVVLLGAGALVLLRRRRAG
jgi:MYXO-CTERM domain-containing protein